MPRGVPALRRLAAPIVLGAAVAPFLLLCLYVHPQNDDYVFATWTLTQGWVETNVFWFRAWQGRYLVTALLSTSPLVLGSFAAYKWGAAAFLALLGGAAYAFVAATSPSAAPPRRAVAALAILALFLTGMPDLAEGLYWMSGAVVYQLGGALVLLALAAALRARAAATRGARVAWTALGAALAVGTAGTNEVSSAHLLALLGGAIAAEAFWRRRLDVPSTVVIAFALAGTAVSLGAPGNALRFESVGHHDAVAALGGAVAQAGRRALEWSTRTPLLPLAVLAIPGFAREAAARPRAPGPHPALTGALLALLFAGSFFPSIYAGGSIEPRTENAIWGLFAVGVLWSAREWVAHVVARREGELRLPRWATAAAAAAAVAAAALPPSNLRLAARDLLSGAAARYDRAQQDRYARIRACPGLHCVVPARSDAPATLSFFEDALDPERDGEFYVRYKLAFAAYFQKAQVRIDPATRPP